MAAKDPLFSHDFVTSVVEYIPDTGLLYWLTSGGGRKKGWVAGTTKPDGRVIVAIARKKIFVHRLAYFIMTEEWPDQIDHIDGNPNNNKWDNLRSVTEAQNHRNSRPHKDNKAGAKGVHKRKDCNRWSAFIMVNRKNIYLGLFVTKEEAIDAYTEASIKYHGEYGRY